MLKASGALLTAAALVLTIYVPAQAEPGSGCVVVDDTGQCLIEAANPGRPGGPLDTGQPNGQPSNASAANHDPCRYRDLAPQPPAGDPLWQGHTPGEGRVVEQYCPPPDGSQLQGGSDWQARRYFFVPNGQEPGAVAPPNPAVLAQRAIQQMTLLKPPIQLAPPPGSAGAVVGVPVWMWIDRGESTSGPVTRSASAGGITVTATARVARVEWQMGDGRTVTCGTPGTPYYASRAQQGSPDCGHVYQRRSLPERTNGTGKYAITATSVWVITWQGGGAQGTQTLRLSATSALAVGELQSVNRDGEGS